MASTPREGGGRPMTPREAPPAAGLQLVVRQKGSAELRNVSSSGAPFTTEALPSFACEPEAVVAEYSPCGKLIACVHSDTGVNIVSSETGALVCTFTKAKVSQLSWSPQSSFLLTWGRWEKDAMNLLVWSVDAPGEPVAAFSQKQPPAPENWPSVQWTADEQVAAHIVTNEVHFYAGNDVGGERTTKLRLEGLKGFSLSPGEGPNYSLSIYRPEHKGLPAQIRLYHYPKLEDGQQVATKAFFNAESVDFKWEARGRAVLVRSSTAVDKGSKGKFSGSSFYYGSSSLYYLTADGSFECAVPLEKEGPVQDVAWVPGNMQFVVLYGFMPAMGTMFDHKCKPLFNYGTGYRNTIKWSNSGRYVALCGFGNLPGDIEFWDRKKGAEGRVGLTKNDATCHSEWSPCSRYFLCATTFPRLRVDNLYNIWNMDGSLHYNERVKSELYQVGFRPGSAAEFPRPPSPKKYLGEQAFAAAAPKAYVPGQGLASRTAVGGAGAGRSMVAGGAYKPPGSRGGSAGGGGRSLAELSGETSAAGKATRPRMQRATVGGFVEDDKPKSKNAAKNAKKKAKAAAAKKAAAEQAAAGASDAREERVEKLQEPRDAPTPAPAPAPADPAKEAKKIQKKLRQIEQLEEKQASGATLDDSQLQKLATKPELEAQLAALDM